MSDSQLHAQLCNVRSLLLSSDRYVVPIYQRNYAWRDEHIQQLLDDILDASRTDAQSAPQRTPSSGYFLGNLIVTRTGAPSHKANRSANHGALYEVVDGQQRLTTLQLVLSALRQHGIALPGPMHPVALQYASRPHASNALQRLAGMAQGDEDEAILEGFQTILLYLHRKLRNDPQQLQHLADFLCEHVLLVRAQLPAKTDLNRYFEVMNTRGQQLQQVDIIKARLMACLPQPEQNCFAWVWDACADMDRYVQMALTPQDTARRTRIFGKNWEWLNIHDWHHLLDIYQGSAHPALKATSAQPLNLAAALQHYAQTAHSGLLDEVPSERFSSIIGFGAFLLHALLVLEDSAGLTAEDETQLDDKHLIARFQSRLQSCNDKAQWAREFALHLLRMRNRFDAWVLKREYTNQTGEDGDWSLQYLSRSDSTEQVQYRSSVASIAAEGKAHLLQLQALLRITYTAPRSMHWITLALRCLSEQDPGQPKQLLQALSEMLRTYARDKVREAFWPTRDMRFDQHPMGFDIERIVFTYLDYLLLLQDQDRHYRFGFRSSIEHFYPQNPPEDARDDVAPQHLHLLGNLALISVNSNSKFSNNAPLAKVTSFKASLLEQSPKLQCMAAITKTHNRWADEHILQHHHAMLNILKQDLHPIAA